MPPDIDLTRGGYGGDDIEEGFKSFTGEHMEYWWHFREVLVASDRKSSARWKMINGSLMPDDDYRELIAVSQLNYAVYTGIAEALSFRDDIQTAVQQNNLFGAKRAWKSLYSSLYGSFNAFCNLAYVVICKASPFGNDPDNPRNPKTRDIKDGLKKVGATSVVKVIECCDARLTIRHQLDHWWTIWTAFIPDVGTQQVSFRLDSAFSRGYIRVNPETEIDWTQSIDVLQRAMDDIEGCADGFNSIYKEMARTDGALDKYLTDNGWYIDYSEFGEPHNGKRPSP